MCDMDNAPHPRRSPWRFSLRELLLLMLAIAAFLGWGRAIYQRYKPFVPTPFASKLDLHADIHAIRQQLGEPPRSWGSSSASGGGGGRHYHRDYRYGFPLQAAHAATFMEMLQRRIAEQLRVGGCKVLGSGHGSSGDLRHFRMHYVRDVTEGSVRVVLITGETKRANLLVFVEEQRQSP